MEQFNARLPEKIVSEFKRTAKLYVSSRDQWQVVAAALSMFMRADPEDQAKAVHEIIGIALRMRAEQAQQRDRPQPQAKRA